MDQLDGVGKEKPKVSVIDELFGPSGPITEEDPFAQIGADDTEDVVEARDDGQETSKIEADNTSIEPEISTPVPQSATTLPTEPASIQLPISRPVTAANDEIPIKAELSAVPLEESSNETPVMFDEGEKDYSELLAELDVDVAGLPDEQYEAIAQDWGAEVEAAAESPAAPQDVIQDTAAPRHSSENAIELEPKAQPIATAAALFADDPTFDSFLPIEPEFDITNDLVKSDPPSPSPVPSLSIERSFASTYQDGMEAGDTSVQSLFSDNSDWLADTTMDDSFAIGQGDLIHAEGAVSDEPLNLEVPEGWYDEEGKWQWYTEEDKEQVRLAMLGQVPGWTDATVANEALLPAAVLSPPIPQGVSENVARRTPQPESIATFPSYEPYAPGEQTAYNPPVPSSSYVAPRQSSSYFPQNPAYTPATTTPAITPSPAQPAASSYDPYAPTPQPYASAYAPPAPVTGYAPKVSTNQYTQQAGPSFQPPKPKIEPPKPPQRMVSTAYDPPFLRPQKSFAKIPSAVPTPAPFVAQDIALPPQSAPTPPPPSGPPRRPKAEQKPSYAQPPPSGLSKAKSYASLGPSAQTQAQNGGFDPPLRPGSTHQQYSNQYQSQDASVPPVPKVDYDRYRSADTQPPLRPPSVQEAQNQYTSPPARNQTPPVLAFSPPPQSGPSYDRPPVAAPPRKASPMFEGRPSSRNASNPPRSPTQQPGGNKLAPPFVNRDFSTRSEEYDGQARSQERSPHTSRGHGSLAPPIQSVLSEFEAEVEDDPEGGGRWQDDGDELAQHEGSGPAEENFTSSLNETSTYGEQSSLGLRQMDKPSSYRQQMEYNSYSPPQTSTRLTDETTYDVAPDRGQQHQNQYSPHHGHQRPTSDPYSAVSQPIQTPRSTTYDPFPQSTYGAPGSQESARPQGSSSYEPSPYAPSTQSQAINYAPATDLYNRIPTPSHASEYGISPQAPNYFRAPIMDDTYVPPQIAEQRPVSEDPLRRCSIEARNAPLAIFGFGGLIITAFPASGDILSGSGGTMHARTPSYGYASHRGQLWIRSVSDLVAPSALKSNDSVFPGPLIMDPSTPKGAVGEKKKKEAVLAYLDARADEIEKGLPFLRSSASLARREEEGRLVLVKLLSALIHGEGKFLGTPKGGEALRVALQNPSSAPSTSLITPATAPAANGFSSSLYRPKSTAPATATSPQLEQLSTLLTDSDKRDAALFAADNGLWSHALVISSSVDQDLWKDIVSRFTRAELGNVKGRSAAIKASYALFSGMDATSVDELVEAANISDDPSADQWREVVSAVVFNGKPTDLGCLDELGIRFTSLGLRGAAHVCHLLSPASPFADITVAAFDKPVISVKDARDEDGIIFSEIAEYARNLLPTPKGLEPPFPGLPQLLPYKLQRAWQAAELGDIDQAQRYCTAVEAASKVGKTGVTPLPRTLAASLEDLVERLTGTPSPNPARIIGGRKTTAKPGFDKLGSWIEGRLTKFIAGEEEGEASEATKTISAVTTKSGKSGPVGPFSHFSTISSNAADIPRAGSIPDFSAPNPGLYSHPDSRRSSPAPRALQPPYSGHSTESSYGTMGSASTAYEEQIGTGYNGSSSYSPWGDQADEYRPDDDTNEDAQENLADEGDFINPMANLSLNSSTQHSYAPSPAPAATHQVEEDDDEDLGFGNKSISRGKTPRPEVNPTEDKNAVEAAKSEDAAPSPAKSDAKPAGWLGRLWGGKKEGQPSGPIRAKLGEESSMVFDKDLKRWVVKGSTPEAAPAPPPPPPRAQTASPSRSLPQGPSRSDRASSATPPPSQAPPRTSSHPPRTASAPTAFSEAPDGGIRRMKSSLQESITASDMSSAGGNPPPPLPSMPPGTTGRPPLSSRANTSTSIDDLLSRPPSKRPASAAKKPMRNRYVDVFQPGSDGA